MPPLSPISLRDLIRYLRQCGFEGPYPGGKHQNMVKGSLRITIPNKHPGDISRSLLMKILKQAEISERSGSLCSYQALMSRSFE